MTEDMLELIRIMDEEGARSIVIGAYALAFLGQPRYTKDLDLWVDAKQADRLLNAVTRFFGGDNLGLRVEDFATPGVIQLGYEPNRVDLIVIEDQDFDAAYERSLERKVGGVRLKVVSPEDFVRLKRAFGRSIDLRDIEGLDPGGKQ
jgi:predicted nucleotidyltransferase